MGRRYSSCVRLRPSGFGPDRAGLALFGLLAFAGLQAALAATLTFTITGFYTAITCTEPKGTLAPPTVVSGDELSCMTVVGMYGQAQCQPGGTSVFLRAFLDGNCTTAGPVNGVASLMLDVLPSTTCLPYQGAFIKVAVSGCAKPTPLPTALGAAAGAVAAADTTPTPTPTCYAPGKGRAVTCFAPEVPTIDWTLTMFTKNDSSCALVGTPFTALSKSCFRVTLQGVSGSLRLTCAPGPPAIRADFFLTTNCSGTPVQTSLPYAQPNTCVASNDARYLHAISIFQPQLIFSALSFRIDSCANIASAAIAARPALLSSLLAALVALAFSRRL